MFIVPRRDVRWRERDALLDRVLMIAPIDELLEAFFKLGIARQRIGRAHVILGFHAVQPACIHAVGLEEVVRVPPTPTGWFAVHVPHHPAVVHDVGGDAEEYWVDLQVRDKLPISLWGITNWGVGGDTYLDIPVSQLSLRGVGWKNLTSSKIDVLRFLHDSLAEQYRLRIWIASPPNDSTGYVAMTQGQIQDIPGLVNLPTKAEDWLINLQTKDTDANGKGINNLFYGGDSFEDASVSKRDGAAIHRVEKAGTKNTPPLS